MSGDSDLRRMLEEVCRADDKQREEFERREYLRERNQAERKRANPEQLVYKTFEPTKHVADLSAEAMERWNAWADAKIDRALFNFLKGRLKELIGALVSELRREWQGEIKKAMLPVMEGWTPRFYNKGSIVLAGGGVYQAREDTAHAPGHSSWNCIAAPGEPGQDGMGAAELNAKLERRLVDLELKLGALIVDRAFERNDDKVIDLPNPVRQRHAG